MINIFELNKHRDERELRRIETYRKILEKMHLRIEDNSKKGYTECFYSVPEFIVGFPSFDQKKAIAYMLDRLFKNGFAVMFIKPNIIYCSWEHIPSSLKNPELKAIETDLMENPYKDYSNLISQISGVNLVNPTKFSNDLSLLNNNQSNTNFIKKLDFNNKASQYLNYNNSNTNDVYVTKNIPISYNGRKY